MKRWSTLIMFSLVLLNIQTINISASSKYEVPYEINNITIDHKNKLLLIDGWGLITNAQHFKGSNTHKYTLSLKASGHTVTSKGTLRNISHTETMFYTGSRWCKENEYHKDSTVCNHTYDNIGFRFSIPLSDFKMDKQYVATLKIETLQSKTSKSISIYFPVKEKLVLKDGKKNYIVDSKLNDMSLKIIFSQVLVRDKAGITGQIQRTKMSCSQNKLLYYQNKSIFNNIYDKTLLNNTTYYKLSGKEAGCVSNRANLNEGNSIYPIWIASTFVDYVGTPLIVKTSVDNTKPVINIKQHPKIYVDDPINFLDGVSAYDEEDGDISHKLNIYFNDFKNKVGNYAIKFEVYDSEGAKAVNTKNVTVVKRNYPPVINAYDIDVKQFSYFDPYLNVSAYDQDMEDLTAKIKATNTVDTKIISTQTQCYSVKDRYNLITNKCINVNIVKLDSNFRLIQKQRLFYKEDVPLIWKDKLTRLNAEIDNEIAYKKRNISK